VQLVPREAAKSYIADCVAVARDLPEFFTEAGVQSLETDAQHHALYVDSVGDKVVAFVVVATKSKSVREILWMAVRPGMQGMGIGSTMLADIEGALRADGARLIEVRTLAATASYPPYERTRRFYERAGFVLLETIHPYPGWDQDSPCAIYVKPLG